MVCYNGNGEKHMVDKVKNICKNIEAWKNNAHSGMTAMIQGECIMVRAVLKGIWKGKHSQIRRRPWISFMESITLLKCTKSWMPMYMDFPEERSGNFSQTLKGVH